MIDNIISFVIKVLKFLISIMLVLLVGIVFSQVILRTFFKSGINWNEEASRFLFVWIIFLGIAASTLDGSHMAMTFLEEKFPKTAIYIQILTWIVSVVFFGVLFRYGIVYSRANMAILSSALQIPMGAVYMIIPVCSALCILFVIYQIYCKIRRKEGKME